MRPGFRTHAERHTISTSLITCSTKFCAVAAIILVVAAGVPSRTVIAKESPRARAERALREGDFDVSEKIFRDLLTRDGSDLNARLGLSYALLKERKLRDAYDHAARAVSVEPLNARAHAILGTVLLSTGDFRLSLEEFRTSLSLRDNEALAVAGLAMIDFYENRLDASVSGLRRATFLDPNEPDFIFNLAQVAARTERYKEAADSYERFLAVAPRTDADRRARIKGLIDFLRYIGKVSGLYLVNGQSHVTVPIEVPDGRPLLTVRLNGRKEPFKFVLDTGSGISVISDETANKLGLKPVARGGNARAVGGGGRFEIVYGFLDSVELGDVRIGNVPVYIRQFYGSSKVDGYIGLSLVNKFLTSIDFVNKSLDLDRTSRAVSGAVVMSPDVFEFRMRLTSSGFVSGEVAVDGVSRPLNFIIDTGASVSVLSQDLVKSEEFKGFAHGGKIRVYGAAGIVDDVDTLLLPRIRIGLVTHVGLNAALLDLEPVNETAGFMQDGIIGGNFLSRYRVTFDFFRGVIRLQRSGAGIQPTPPPSKGVPIS